MLITYQKEEIPVIWEMVEPFIHRGLDRGSIYTIEDVYDGLRNNSFQLWTFQNPQLKAVLITQILENNCYLLILSGINMKEWLWTLVTIEEWAKSLNCKKMKIHGRKGWSRILNYNIIGKDELNLYICEKTL